MSADAVFTPGNRPRVVILPSPADRVLEALSLAGLALTLAYLLLVWQRLPLRVPTHFGFWGEPDQWGQRSSLLLYAILPPVIHFGLSLLARFPWAYNYPVAVTAGNHLRLYAAGRGLMLWLRTEVVWLLAVLCYQTVQVALGRAHGLGPALPLAPLVAIFGTIIVFTVRMCRRGPAPAGGQ